MDISGANVVIMLSVPGIAGLAVPQQIQGFAVDDVYDLDEYEPIETMMGVDGTLSAGFVWKAVMNPVTLMADSPSNSFFDTWQSSQIAAQQSFPANGTITIPALGLQIVQTTGYLRGYKLPGGKKLIQPRRFRLEWNLCVPVPVANI